MSDRASANYFGGAQMRARPGDRLLAGSGSTGLIIDVLGSDGQPPYVVKWLRTGHIAMVVPDQYARVIPADHIQADHIPGDRAHVSDEGQPTDNRG